MKFSKQTFWKNIFQILFALLCIGLAIYFILKERHELGEAKKLLLQARRTPVCIGVGLTLLYIWCQALMYLHSFKTIGQTITFSACLNLYLKRNVASVFLPGGGITSLAFFKGEIEKQGASKSQIYFSSIIYGFTGIFSVFVIALPILGYAVLKHSYGSAVYFSFGALILLLVAILTLVHSVYRQGWVYKIIVKYKPAFEHTVADLRKQPFLWWHFFLTNIFSLFIEVIGIVHLYFSIAAIGLTPSWEASMIGYVVSVIFLTISPFMRGLGGIEVSMVLVLGIFGIGTAQALSATLLFRIFEFWFPLLAGLIAFVIPGRWTNATLPQIKT